MRCVTWWLIKRVLDLYYRLQVQSLAVSLYNAATLNKSFTQWWGYTYCFRSLSMQEAQLYRRGTSRRDVNGNVNCCTIIRKHLKRHAVGEWPWRSLNVIGISAIRSAIFHILFFSCPRSEGWPHHGRTFSIYLFSVILIDSSAGSPVHNSVSTERTGGRVPPGFQA